MTRHALVTGGGTGLGLAVTRRLVADGLHVAIVGRRRTVLEDAAAELGPSVTAHVADVTDPAAVAGLVQALPEVLESWSSTPGATPHHRPDSAWTRDRPQGTLDACHCSNVRRS